MYKAYRQIISYHREFGHQYVPNIHVRMRYGNDAYFLQTDSLGFRNNPEKPEGKLKILLLGDSYAAGDGVCNEDRFSDYLEQNFDCVVHNLAVNGYGVDQQILVYESYKNQIPHDIVLFAPHMDDLYRNMRSARLGTNREGANIEIPKPYFEIENDQLVVKNIPVPKKRAISEKLESEIPQANRAFHHLKNKVKYALNRTVGKNLIGNISYPELNDRESGEWQLMSKLLARLQDLVGDKKLVVCPIPYNYIVANNEPQYYEEIFNEFLKGKSILLDPTKPLQKAYRTFQDQIFLPLCGHFTKKGHAAIGEFLAEKLSALGLQKRGEIKHSLVTTETKYVLGISCYYHDSAAAIIKDGVILAAAQEERFSRKKHDKGFPYNAIHYCLEEAKIHINDLAAVCYYDDEAWTIERVLNNFAVLDEDEKKNYWEMVAQGLVRKLTLQNTLKSQFSYTGKVHKTTHHHSHAASAYYPSPYDHAAIVVVDGVGEWACSTIGVGDGTKIKLLKQQNYPHSLGLLYSAITYFCGFKVNSGEYKLMGLAPYGQPKYADVITDRLITVHDDGSIHLHMEYFSFLKGDKMTSDKLAELFDGPERQPESRITQREMDLAASVQAVTEQILSKMLHHAHQLTGSDYCVLAGGVALNCVANGKLIKEGPFKDIWIQPAAGDAGGALGAAFDFHYQHLETTQSKQKSEQTHSYYGPEFTDLEIKSFLDTHEIIYHQFEKRSEELSEWIAAGNIVGYFDGRMEFGPRALGARSFVADPTNTEMQRKVNLKIKYRESFRPFAPIVAEENLSDYFDLDRPSPFMLVVAPVVEKLRRKNDDLSKGEDMLKIVNQVRSELPAITHVDYSARLQSVNNTDNNNPNFYELLKAFQQQSGYAVLVNTSFNVRGEPIVCSPEDAFRCFMRTETDILVLGDYYLRKSEQAAWQDDENWKETFELD